MHRCEIAYAVVVNFSFHLVQVFDSILLRNGNVLVVFLIKNEVVLFIVNQNINVSKIMVDVGIKIFFSFLRSIENLLEYTCIKHNKLLF